MELACIIFTAGCKWEVDHPHLGHLAGGDWPLRALLPGHLPTLPPHLLLTIHTALHLQHLSIWSIVLRTWHVKVLVTLVPSTDFGSWYQICELDH